MRYIATQNDYDLLKQAVQEIHVKVELCDKALKVLDSLEGIILNDNFNQTNGAQQRRSYQCDFHVSNATFLVGHDKKIWMDKRLKVYYGVRSLRTKEICWYLIGTFVYVDVNYSYTSVDHTVSITCADLMAEYDGTLNGQLEGYGSANSSEYATQGLLIPAGEDIRSSVIALIKGAGIVHYLVEDINREIPYDLEFNTGITYAEVWKQISELYDSWEFFFDTDGTFIWRKIPTGLEEPVILTNSVLNEIFVDEKISSSFTGIYNVTEVWGKVLELEHGDRYAENTSYSNNVYRVDFDEYSSWDDIGSMTKFAFKPGAGHMDSPKFSVNGYPPIPICDGDGLPLTAGILSADNVYVFRYRRVHVDGSGIKSELYLLGQFQCYGKYIENSDHCPFSVKNLGYEIRNSIDYEGLSDDAACYNQAEYLTYKTTAMLDTVTLTTLVIPWLEVNSKIEYRPVSSDADGELNQYIVKDVSWSTGNGTMTMTLYKFQESFSYIYKNKKEE